MTSAYVGIKTHMISYAKRVAAETDTEETAWYPQEKDRMKNKRCPNRNRKREGREEK